jgi:hypothetical protein
MGGERVIVDAAMQLRARHKLVNDVMLDRDAWAEVFKDGGVAAVQVRPDSVLIVVGPRMYLLVFEKGVAGYGTRRISNQLWYWGGEESGLKQRDRLQDVRSNNSSDKKQR